MDNAQEQAAPISKQSRKDRAAQVTIPTTRPVIPVSLGSKGARGNWNSVIDVTLADLPAETVDFLIEKGLRTVLGSVIATDDTEEAANVKARERLAELIAGELAQRKTALTAVERVGLELARKYVRDAAATKGQVVKSADVDTLARGLFEKNRTVFEDKARQQIEAEKQFTASIQIDF